MRLQLTVQRQGIPAVHVLWTVRHIRPPLAAAGSSITVSQFLEQVNDIIPLESADWGLEDYVVEVHGFECLHFSELGQIFNEDDAVSIRPLQTTDLRIRRISGRHQISADGKHLIDGVAFGRPYLRRPARPAVRIPPRKRRRIEYDEADDSDGDDEEEVTDQQILMGAGFNDADEFRVVTESSEAEESQLGDEGDEDLGAELEDLQNDVQAGAQGNKSMLLARGSQGRPRTTRRKSRGSPKGLGLLKLLDENGQPFVGEYNNPLLDEYVSNAPAALPPIVITKKRRPGKYAQSVVKNATNGMSIQRSSANLRRASRRDSAGSNKSVHFDEGESSTPATIRESQISDEEDDDDFVPSEIDESDKENAEPSDAQNSLDDHQSGTSESSSTSSSESTSIGSSNSGSTASSHQSDSDETSSSGSSSTDSSSDSESEPERILMKSLRQNGNLVNAAMPKSSNIGSSSKGKVKKASESKESANNTQLRESIVDSASPQSPATRTVPRGQGKKTTAQRNQRRREQKALGCLKRQGILTPEASIADLRKYKETHLNEDADMKEPLDDAATSLADAFNFKRQALLASINSGGIDADATPHAPNTNDQPSDRREIDVEMTQPENQSNQVKEAPNHADIHYEPITDAPAHARIAEASEENVTTESSVIKMQTSTPNLPAQETPDPSTQRRRSKLDVSGAKRLLFGSLGLKTTKTKEDESKTREKLMKDVKPIKGPQPEDKIETLEEIAADDSWKSKIDLRAVECCYEGIKLSTPPFPFVQRWDPQQQRGYFNKTRTKRKGKKRKRNNSSYYENGSYEDSQSKVGRHNEYQPPNGESEPVIEEGSSDHQGKEVRDGSYDQSFEDSQAVNEQLLRESGEPSTHTLRDIDGSDIDLPSLPEDPSACPSLTREAAKEGTIIAFKQLEMSAETNWQPNISEYKTAIVNEVMDNGVLQMTPANRDRREKPVEYDDETGERLYSRFEMPGYNEEDDGSKLEISFDELINPILIRAAQDQFGLEKEGITQTEDLSREVTSVAYPEDVNKAVNGSGTSLDSAADKPIEQSEESREEISELIRDAGWRSSLRSGVNGDLVIRGDPSLPEKTGEHDQTTLMDAASPRFNGFSSSPLVNVRSSPPFTEEKSPKRPHASGTEIAESVPPQDSSAGSATSDTKHAIGYPDLPHLGDDSELFNGEAQHRSDPPLDQQILSQDLISDDMDRSPAWSNHSNTKPTRDSSPSKSSRHSDRIIESEEEFPEPFSQAWNDRISQERNIKSEFSQEPAISPLSYKSLRKIGTRASSQRESNQSWKPDGEWSAFEEDHEDDGASTPRPSQQQKSSQVVDLTISSDSVDIDQQKDDDESYELPKGPGWVKKKRASKEGSTPVKVNVGKAKSRQR